jgi:hypothetical protein
VSPTSGHGRRVRTAAGPVNAPGSEVSGQDRTACGRVRRRSREDTDGHFFV